MEDNFSCFHRSRNNINANRLGTPRFLDGIVATLLEKSKYINPKTVIKSFLKDFVFNLIAAVISSLFSLAVNRLTPKNYSSFAHSRYLKDAKSTPAQIRKQMATRFKQVKVSKQVFDFIAGVVSSAASKKKYRWA